MARGASLTVQRPPSYYVHVYSESGNSLQSNLETEESGNTITCARPMSHPRPPAANEIVVWRRDKQASKQRQAAAPCWVRGMQPQLRRPTSGASMPSRCKQGSDRVESTRPRATGRLPEQSNSSQVPVHTAPPSLLAPQRLSQQMSSSPRGVKISRACAHTAGTRPHSQDAPTQPRATQAGRARASPRVRLGPHRARAGFAPLRLDADAGVWLKCRKQGRNLKQSRRLWPIPWTGPSHYDSPDTGIDSI